MKKGCLLILMLLTYYIAGSYRSLPLMIASITEAILAVFMIFTSFYLKRQLHVAFLKKSDIAYKGQIYTCKILTENRGMLPAYFQVSFKLCNLFFSEKAVLRSNSDRKSRDALPFFIRFPSCGLYEIQIEKIRIYDPIRLFRRRRKSDEKMEIAVLPSAEAADLSFLGEESEGDSGTPFPSPEGTPAQEEVRQIRDYAPGDSIRHIHWNQSARMETLLIREYETESRGCCFLFLTNRTRKSVNEERLERFYHGLWSLTAGLLERFELVLVQWYCTQSKGIRSAEVAGEEGMQAMMRMLYEGIGRGTEIPLGRAAESGTPEGERGLYLDYDLTLYNEEGLKWDWRNEES